MADQKESQQTDKSGDETVDGENAGNTEAPQVTAVILPPPTSQPPVNTLGTSTRTIDAENIILGGEGASTVGHKSEPWADATDLPAITPFSESLRSDVVLIGQLLDRLLKKVKAVEELQQEISRIDSREATIQEVDCYERLMDEEWGEFMDLQTPLAVEVTSDHEYHHSNGNQRARRARRSAPLTIANLKARIDGRNNPGPSLGASASHNLARLSLKPFNGDVTSWKEFSDMFQSMIGKTSMDKVGKFMRLRNALTGPAAELLKTFPTTEASYDKAWEKLKSTYENPRLIAQQLFNRLLTLPKVQKATSKAIADNVHRAQETFDQLIATAGIAREDLGEQFVVHLLRSSVDPTTRKDLEVKIGASTKFTKLSELSGFLNATARGLRAGEGLQNQSTGKKPPTGQQGQQRGAAYQVAPIDPPPQPTDRPTPSTCCACCKSQHFVGKCSRFRTLSVLQKRAIIADKRICYNCLGSHNVNTCGSTKLCLRCNGKHHTLICERDLAQQTGGETIRPPDRQETPSVVNNTGGTPTNHSLNDNLNAAVLYQSVEDNRPNVLLATALARAQSSTGTYTTARLLIDQGSELTFIAERLVNQLKLQRRSSTIHLTGIGNTNSGHTKGVVSIRLASRHEPHQHVNLNAHILPRLTTKLPSFSVPSAKLGALRQLQLADDHFLRPGPIDILLGADNYWRIAQHRSLTTKNSQLVGQLTVFGWTLCGPLTTSTVSTGKVLTAVRHEPYEELLQLLQKFWVQEELPRHNGSITNDLTPGEQECERHFISTHTRDSTGRYVIRLPLKASSSDLGESKATALRQAYSVNRRLKSDANYRQLYTDFINEYESTGHMRKAPTAPEPSTCYYLPHHGVLRAESLTTKLRVVSNGSSKSSTAVSLNDILHTGQKLQVDALDVLTWMRKHKFVFGTDISKMFRQINVHPDDWDLQRILWINEKDMIIPYQLTTVTYGLSCSPWLALRVLQQLTIDEGQQFPRAIQCITKGRYVDDIYGGANTAEELEDIILDLQHLCMAGGFPLHKWTSNKPEVLEKLGLDQATPITVAFKESIVKVLGLCWQPSTDNFHYKSREFNGTDLSKRKLLSELAQIFDPLGFLAPVIIRLKILIQELWCLKLDWDEPLPATYTDRWNVFREELTQLDQLSIPRWLGTTTDPAEFQLHGFADASTAAMGAVVYLRTQPINGTPTIALVCAKTKVAPLKRLTVPRLKLTAALLLTELVQHTQRMLEKDNSKIILWTDSSVALAWINSHPSRWKEYVHNRVVKIRESLPNAQWRHVSGTDNPADCASRGISTTQLVDHPLWWTGPSWLQLPEEEWPQSALTLTQREETLEEKPTKAHPVAAQRINEFIPWMERFSRLSRLLQVTATVNRAICRFRRQPVPDSTNLTQQELNEARLFWAKVIQHQYFSPEIQLLQEGQQLPRNNALQKLIPLIDEIGIMRLGGRLTNAPLNPEQIHPIILPKDSYFSELIIRNAHLKTLHGGNQQTLAYVREKYWIIGGRHTVKSVIHRCFTCTRFKGQRAYQLMGQLPASRVTPSRPFLHTGVDFAGPIPILKWRGTGARSTVGYMSVFVCFSTGAIHLEAVSSLSTEAFIAAYKRFAGRRGIPEVMYSDRGANFTGAAGVLHRSAEQLEKEHQDVIQQVASNGTTWKFTPPRASHFGGKWEAGVKSMKHHLKRVIGDTRLTFEELSTLLAQIEAILNSRPIAQLSDDPTDSTALTPGHFLIGGALATVPEPSRLQESRVKPPRWKWITQKTQDFWNQWYRECLQHHQSLSKWRERNQNINEGQLVLVTEDDQTPSRWPLAMVVKRYVGKDGLVRVVDLRCNKKIIRRSIHKLCVLPIMPINDEENQLENELDILPEDEVEPGTSGTAQRHSLSDEENDHQRANQSEADEDSEADNLQAIKRRRLNQQEYD